jgi:hypothetical protein
MSDVGLKNDEKRLYLRETEQKRHAYRETVIFVSGLCQIICGGDLLKGWNQYDLDNRKQL